MSVSTALPCRISIYEKNGKAILATVRPTTLLAMFNTPQLERVAREVQDTDCQNHEGRGISLINPWLK
jgi:uncharacterized protein (DUF302 family)